MAQDAWQCARISHRGHESPGVLDDSHFCLRQRKEHLGDCGILCSPPEGEQGMSGANQERTLLPMLIAGLLLVSVGGIIIMLFV